jgi:hypothetical protein
MSTTTVVVIAVVAASTVAVVALGRALVARLPRFRRLIWTGIMLVYGASALWVGKRGGEVAADALEPRFEILWPEGLRSLQVADRALVLKAAIKCELINVQTNAGDVAHCLRLGARKADEHDAEMTVTNRLEQLLRAAPSTGL